RNTPTDWARLKDELQTIIDVVNELPSQLSPGDAPLLRALEAVLNRCKETCGELEKLLKSCTKHDESRLGQIFDTMVFHAKKGDIEQLKKEISLTLQIMAVTVISLNLRSSEANADNVMKRLDKVDIANKNVSDSLAKLKEQIEFMENFGGQLSQDVTKKLSDNQKALAMLLELGQESRGRIERCYHLTIGNTVTDNHSGCFVATDSGGIQDYTSVGMMIGNTTTTNQSLAVVGPSHLEHGKP
ncbi:hypothetical protein F5Y03DRAFT_275355, partial [Xylaria venustula]